MTLRSSACLARMAAATLVPSCVFVALSVCPGVAAANDCFLRCESAPTCRVASPPGEILITNAKPVSPKRSCMSLGEVSDGRLEAMLRVKGRINVLLVPPQGNLSAALRSFGPPDCVLADPVCSAQRDKAMQAGRAGKAFDGATGHAPAGSPCAIGLPCGIVLAPTQAWRLQLSDARAADATLQIAALRMASGSIDVPVRDGRAEVAPGFVRAGASYSYALKSRSGEVIAAGQFSAAASAIEADVRAAERAALDAGRSAVTARLEALLVNELDWDAMLLSRP